MIIYGWNTSNLKQGPLKTHKCPSCGEHNSQIAILAHYAHVFWIPLFVYKKAAHIVCMTCNYSLEGKDFSDEEKDMKQNIKALKSSVRVPFYLYIGSIVVALGVGFIVFQGIQRSNLEDSYVENPQAGDVYVLKDLEEVSRFKYYLLKVNEIEGDSLHLTFNSFSYDRAVTSLDAQDGFYDVWYSLHKDQLKAYQESGALKKVLRDYSAYSGFDRVIEYEIPDSTIVQQQQYQP